MFRNLQISLRHKLGFWMLVVGIGPLLFAGLLTLSVFYTRLFLFTAQIEEIKAFLRTNVAGRNLTGVASDTVVDIDAYLIERINDVRSWSEEDTLIAIARQASLAAQESGLALIAGDNVAVKEKLNGALFVPVTYPVFSPGLSYALRQLENHPIYLEILLTDAHGLNALATRRVDQVAHANETWWQDASRLDHAGIGVIGPFVDDVTGQPALAIALPVVDPDTNHVLGSLRAVLSLGDLQSRLSQKAIRDFADIQVFTAQGGLIADTASNHSLQVVISSTLNLDGTPAGMALSAQPGPDGSHFMFVEDPSGGVLVGYAHTSGSELYNQSARISGFQGFLWGVTVTQPDLLTSQVVNNLITAADEFIELPHQLGWLFGMTSLLAASFSLMGALIVSSQIGGRLSELNRQAQCVREGNLDVQVTHCSPDEIGVLESTFNEMINGLRQREQEDDLFGQSVPREVHAELSAGKLELDGETRWATVLCTRIHDFSTISERISPQKVVALLNEYRTEMIEAIRPWGGYINGSTSDSIIAVFGVPLDRPDKEWKAVAAAISMCRCLKALNECRTARHEPIIISGIGIFTGEVIVGRIGPLDHSLYTIIGNAVNMAAHLESLTKDETCDILINSSTAEAESLHGQRGIVIKNLGSPVLGDCTEPVELFAVFEKGDPMSQSDN